MSNKRKSTKSKVSRKNKPPRQNSRRQSNPPPQQREYSSTADLQQSDEWAGSEADNSINDQQRSNNGDDGMGNYTADSQQSINGSSAGPERDSNTIDLQRGNNSDDRTGNNTADSQQSINSSGVASERDSNTIDLQRRSNGGAGSETGGTKLADRWFRNPLFSKRGIARMKTVGKKKDNPDDNTSRYFSIIFLFSFPFFIVAYTIFGFRSENNNSITMHAIVYGGPLFIAIPYFIRYLDDVDILFLSIFEMEERSFLGYFADPFLREFCLALFEIEELIRQFVKGRHDIPTFAFGILGFGCYLVGNILLILKSKWVKSNTHTA